MTLHLWWLYVIAVFLVSATPGPNMLHVMSQSIRHGPSKAGATMSGLMTANLLCLFASALGLGAVLKASPNLFDLLRYSGVAYLFWLGVKVWRAPIVTQAGQIEAPQSSSSLYAIGFLTGMANPKLIIFAAALFPQFIDLSRPFWLQLGILIATFVLIEGFWYMSYALGGARLARWLEPVHRQKMFNRATGALFVGFGVALLGARR